jgi:hypothetical protein
MGFANERKGKKGFTSKFKDNCSPLLPILYSRKTRFEDLKEIFSTTKLKGIKESSAINLFIDVRSIYGTIFTKFQSDLITNLKPHEKLLICSELVNLAAHYKLFLYKRYRKFVNIFYIDSNPSSYCTEIDPNYKKDHFKRRELEGDYGPTVSFVKSNIDLAKEIFDAIPNIYYISAPDTDSIPLPLFLLKDFSFGEDSFNLILSNQTCFLPYLMSKLPFAILTMKSDKSTLITQKNVFESLIDVKKGVVTANFSYRLLVPFLSMIGDKKLELKGVERHGFLTTTKYFNRLIKENLLQDSIYSLEDFIKVLDLLEVSEENKAIIKKNWKILHPFEHYLSLSEETKAHIEESLVDNPKPDVLYKLNHRFFKTNALKFDYLFLGEEE